MAMLKKVRLKLDNETPVSAIFVILYSVVHNDGDVDLSSRNAPAPASPRDTPCSSPFSLNHPSIVKNLHFLGVYHHHLLLFI
ncbi:hypothetical protein PIB30_049926 [Stylosanthes scabra]|uniref:Uncharacterized protein n=1 Tax=Stylosanthes scabra TaxID=79078 RepID=A0ABU6QHQ5_9FABA|nr:hypothetical protein [Stylosanthes scabra]